MGIDISTWRSRIGKFGGGRSKLFENKVKIPPLPLTVIETLLIIGGVEVRSILFLNS